MEHPEDLGTHVRGEAASIWQLKRGKSWIPRNSHEQLSITAVSISAATQDPRDASRTSPTGAKGLGYTKAGHASRRPKRKVMQPIAAMLVPFLPTAAIRLTQWKRVAKSAIKHSGLGYVVA